MLFSFIDILIASPAERIEGLDLIRGRDRRRRGSIRLSLQPRISTTSKNPNIPTCRPNKQAHSPREIKLSGLPLQLGCVQVKVLECGEWSTTGREQLLCIMATGTPALTDLVGTLPSSEASSTKLFLFRRNWETEMHLDQSSTILMGEAWGDLLSVLIFEIREWILLSALSIFLIYHIVFVYQNIEYCKYQFHFHFSHNGWISQIVRTERV